MVNCLILMHGKARTKSPCHGTACEAHLSAILEPHNILWQVAPRNDNVIMRGFGNVHDVKAVSISSPLEQEVP